MSIAAKKAASDIYALCEAASYVGKVMYSASSMIESLIMHISRKFKDIASFVCPDDLVHIMDSFVVSSRRKHCT